MQAQWVCSSAENSSIKKIKKVINKYTTTATATTTTTTTTTGLHLPPCEPVWRPGGKALGW